MSVVYAQLSMTEHNEARWTSAKVPHASETVLRKMLASLVGTWRRAILRPDPWRHPMRDCIFIQPTRTDGIRRLSSPLAFRTVTTRREARNRQQHRSRTNP